MPGWVEEGQVGSLLLDRLVGGSTFILAGVLGGINILMIILVIIFISTVMLTDGRFEDAGVG